MQRSNTIHDMFDDLMYIDLYFACRNLPDMDFITITDPFLLIYRKNSSGVFTQCGQTEQIDNTLNPTFARSIRVAYYFERKCYYKIEAYDYDSPSKTNYIGECEFELGYLVGSLKKMLELKLEDKKSNGNKHRGEVLLRYETIASNNNKIRLDINGEDIYKKRMLHSNRNYLAFYKKPASGIKNLKTDVNFLIYKRKMKIGF